MSKLKLYEHHTILVMNINSAILMIATCMTIVACSNDRAAGSETEDKRLSQIFEKMKGASGGMAMNLDSTFGGGRCNCVCKDNT